MKNKSELFRFKALEVLVLDEADTLLDMGFKQTLNEILSLLPKQRRTGLFSATQTTEVKELARAGMRNPVSVSVRIQNPSKLKSEMTINSNNYTNRIATPITLENYYMISEHDDRPVQLAKFIIKNINMKIIIFCATCACVDYYSKVFKKLAKENYLPSKLEVVGFHGKMIPKKRKLLYKKFLELEHGIMFTTDVAARGIDIPDIDWIIQLAAPKNPDFFVHRVGRTARAGKNGQALLFVSDDESAYVELLKGRGVPLLPITSMDDFNSNTDEIFTDEEITTFNTNCTNILNAMKGLATKDRELLEAGSTAFMSFLRSYKEHMCSFIFRLEQLDIGAVARSYALLRLPKIPETRGKKGKPIVFETSPVDTSTIPFLHKEKEKARKRRLEESKLAEANRMEEMDENSSLRSAKNSIRTTKSGKSSVRTGRDSVKKAWIPPEEFAQLEEAKRVRKKKQTPQQKMLVEWDELAAEELAFKKFKKGKLSKEEYDDCLETELSIELDPSTNEAVIGALRTSKTRDKIDKQDDDSVSDDSNDEEDSSADEQPSKKARKQVVHLDSISHKHSRAPILKLRRGGSMTPRKDYRKVKGPGSKLHQTKH